MGEQNRLFFAFILRGVLLKHKIEALKNTFMENMEVPKPTTCMINEIEKHIEHAAGIMGTPLQKDNSLAEIIIAAAALICF